MKFNLLTMMILPLALLAGCGTTIAGDTYCDLSRFITFEDQSVVDVTNPDLLRQIVLHNEIREKMCS